MPVRRGAVLFCCLVLATAAQPARAQAPDDDPARTGHVYLIAGLAGVFSLGLNDLAGELRRKGIAATVHSHRDPERLAAAAVAEYARTGGPIAIVGHSLGATAAVYMATALERSHAPVALLVVFDTSRVSPVPGNVQHLANFYTDSLFSVKSLPLAETFDGTVENVDVNAAGMPGAQFVQHFNIDSQAYVRQRTIELILQYAP